VTDGCGREVSRKGDVARGCRGSTTSIDAGAAGTGGGYVSEGRDPELQFYESALVRMPKTENV
jgi:hypothetical protein